MAAGPWTFQFLKFPDRRSGLGMAHQTPREEGRTPGTLSQRWRIQRHARPRGFLSGSHRTCDADAAGLEPGASTC